ncbi:replication initiation protein [Thiolinea disciformis]|uniref:replication initiation protein n=1 Tax=Thiolinea disciformis TaxID=125614 RepID=UPI00037474AF|nr:replication initiation protein [Thiolinea disciformis]
MPKSTLKQDSAITISNEIIRSAQGLNLWEKRILMLAVSKIDSKVAIALGAGEVTLKVSDLVSLYKVNKDSAYQEAKKAAEGIMKRQIRLKPTDSDSRLIQWVIESAYQQREGRIQVELHPKLIPYLQALKMHFTSYKLSRVSGLQSVYSWRLFELLMQFKKTGLLTILIDDFYHAMDAPESLRANFSNLRNRVIEPAVKEIRAKDGLAVEWEALKAGRKVKALRFSFPTEPSTLAVEPLKTPVLEPKRKIDNHPEKTLSKKDALSRYTGALNLAKLSNQAIDTLVSVQELEAFKYYGLIE